MREDQIRLGIMAILLVMAKYIDPMLYDYDFTSYFLLLVYNALRSYLMLRVFDVGALLIFISLIKAKLIEFYVFNDLRDRKRVLGEVIERLNALEVMLSRNKRVEDVFDEEVLDEAKYKLKLYERGLLSL